MAHSSAYIGLGAVVLYVLGIVATVGQMRASDIDVQYGLSLVPLDRHLRNGIGILSDPWIWVLIALFVAIYAWLMRSRSSVSDGNDQAPQPRDAFTKRLDRFMSPVVYVGASLVLPWPYMIAMAVMLGPPVLLGYFGQRLGREPMLLVIRLLPLAFASTVVLLIGLNAYYRSSPLPKVSFQSQGSTVSGPLISVAEGLIYLGPTTRKGLCVSVPLSTVTSRLDVTRTERREEASVLNMLHIVPRRTAA